MASSLALIPWNQSDANKVVATIDGNSRPEGGKQWALVVHAFLNPSPGRTLDRMYTSLGAVLQKRANRAAHAVGMGPQSVTDKIKFYFGSGEERVQRLDSLQIALPPNIKKLCFKLVKYTLPAESADTQCLAFKNLVELVTILPGLRQSFLLAKCLNGAVSPEAILALWNRSTSSPDIEWVFWKTLAASSLSHSNISSMLEGCTILELSTCEGEGISVIERLLIECDFSSRGEEKFTSALCLRYLGGILDLPGFWLDMHGMHVHIANKLCRKMVQVLKDLGVDVLALGIIDEQEPPFDYNGLDFLGTRILNGVSGWFTQLEGEEWSAQPWYEKFIELVELLRRPRAEELFPQSSAYAVTNFQDIFPTCYKDADLNVVVDGNEERQDNQNSIHDCLADLDCEDNSAGSVHSRNSDQNDDQDLNSLQDASADAHSQGSDTNSLEQSRSISSISDEDTYEFDTQLDVCDFESGSATGQGSNWSRDSDLKDSGMHNILGGQISSNSTPHPSLEARLKDAKEQKITLYEKQRDLGDDHPETLAAMEDLAWIHNELGEFRFARDLWIIIFQKRRSFLGEHDPRTLRVMLDLAYTYRELGQLKEAEDLCVQLLEMQRDVQGEDHPETLYTMNTLAVIYHGKGKFKDAETLQVQLLEKYRQILGEDHPDTMNAMNALAGTLKAQGQYHMAEHLEVRVLEKQKEAFGEYHLNTLAVMGNLATTYFQLGENEKAEKLESEVIEKRRRLLGEQHPDTLQAMSLQASIYQQTGRPTAAEELAVTTLEKQKKWLGDDHPNTIYTMETLGWIYVQKGQLECAEELYTVILERRRKNLGDDHPDTKRAVRNLAWTYRNLNKTKEAEDLEALIAD
ncbi:hypothetical protein MVEN_01443800 [Mycena venus]|uniref:Kinesin light chain n=1 Tax=Mycena venus TaxID=2733690 RepID=A0A8H7CQY5_9AGAR|nr:hypothetical protein MVEN_01443800 [Mycena venus]